MHSHFHRNVCIGIGVLEISHSLNKMSSYEYYSKEILNKETCKLLAQDKTLYLRGCLLNHRRSFRIILICRIFRHILDVTSFGISLFWFSVKCAQNMLGQKLFGSKCTWAKIRKKRRERGKKKCCGILQEDIFTVPFSKFKA